MAIDFIYFLSTNEFWWKLIPTFSLIILSIFYIIELYFFFKGEEKKKKKCSSTQVWHLTLQIFLKVCGNWESLYGQLFSNYGDLYIIVYDFINLFWPESSNLFHFIWDINNILSFYNPYLKWHSQIFSKKKKKWHS